MSPAGFATADDKGKFQLGDVVNKLGVIQGICVDVYRPPQALVVLVDGNNADTLFAV